MNLDILDNKIIICEDSYKKAILKGALKSQTLLRVKFYSKKEFFREYFFSYDEESIYYVVKKYKVKVSIAKMYLENLILIEDKEYQNEKLKFLKKLKEELKEEHLLKENPLFKEFITSKEIMVIGYLFLEKWEEEIFNKLKANIIMPKENSSLKEVIEFPNREEEVNYVAREICKLILKGVSINKIKLMNVSEDYYDLLERIFSFYHIPVRIPSKVNLLGYNITHQFLDDLRNKKLVKFFESIPSLEEKIVSKIINIWNKYLFLDDINDAYDLIYEDFKNTYVDFYNREKYIELLDFNDCPGPDNYIFLLNFNANSIPNYVKDESYMTDKMKDEVSLYPTNILNEKIKTNTILKLKSMANLVITYKLKDAKLECFPSNLVSLMSLDIKIPHEENLLSYSHLADALKYASYLDEMNKYGNIAPDLGLYKNNFPKLPYKTFTNKYQKISPKSLKEYLNKGLTLSYSSLNNYNRCHYRYYLENILNLNPFTETFDTFIGSLFHDVLEKCLNSQKDISSEVENYLHLHEKILDPKEKFYVTKLMKDMEFVLAYLKEQKEEIGLKDELHEKYIVINKKSSIPVKFVGIVDKILYKKEGNKTIVAIVDYKTGNVESEINYALYGLAMQLPIYLYLVVKSKLFPNPVLAGFYLEHILDKDLKRSDDYLLKRKDSLKLRGYSNKDIAILKQFDRHYENSNLIKGLRTNSKGDFSSYSKVLSNEEISRLLYLTEETINMDIVRILRADFSLSPIKIGYEKDLGCMYCPFSDICFKEEKDYIILDEIKDLSYLGGE